MRTRLAALGFFVFSLVWMLFAVGCGASDDPAFTGTGSGGATSASAGGAGGDGCVLDCNSGGSGVGGNVAGLIDVTPKNVQLVVDNGTIPTQVFKAEYNGNDITSSVTWIYERPDIGDVASGALFTPTGNVGGNGVLTAKLSNAEGSTNVSVIVKKVLNTGGITPAQIAAFDNPSGPDPSMALLYPYDKTVFPLGVLAPEIQWNGGQGGDLYRLKMTEKYYEYTEYFTTTLPARHLVGEGDWTNVESSGSGPQTDPLGVELARMSGNVAFQGVKQTWHIAQGRLHGSVYYWELPDQCQNGSSSGRILRIKPDSAVVDEFFQPGVCWGCHTVSRDGAKMAAEFNDGNGPIYTLDLTQNPAVYGDINPGKPAGNMIFSAFNEKGDKLLASDNTLSNPAAAELRILDAVTGQTLNPSALGPGCGEPAWSPDGKKIAGICGLGGGGWIFDATTGNLVVADIAADGVTVSNPLTVAPQAGGQGRPAYPSFSPGSEWISFGRPTFGSRSAGDGDLWLVAPDGTGMKKLAKASEDNRSFNPVFAPLRAGGYFWIVFITRRDYGNTLVNQNRQQLWITAIDDPPTAADPSHPPFYLRGQEGCGKSENAYYALDPCKKLGEGCLSGIDCCNGQCIKDPNSGDYVCGEPSEGCSQDGNACTTTADCCNAPSSTCIDGFCQHPVPK